MKHDYISCLRESFSWPRFQHIQTLQKVIFQKYCHVDDGLGILGLWVLGFSRNVTDCMDGCTILFGEDMSSHLWKSMGLRCVQVFEFPLHSTSTFGGREEMVIDEYPAIYLKTIYTIFYIIIFHYTYEVDTMYIFLSDYE